MTRDLPSNWTEATLDQVALINPPGTSTVVPDDQAVTFLPMAAVEELTGRINVTTAKPFGAVKRGFTRFRDGDVLFAKITPCMENGKIAVAHGLLGGVGCGSTEFHVLRPREAVSADYLRYFLVQSSYRRVAQRNMQGAVGQQRVPPDFLRQSPIPLPPLAEQRRIVSRIEELFSEIDEGERVLEHAQKLVERYRQSVLKAAVTGNLTVDWLAHEEGQSRAGVCTAEAFAIEKPSIPASWRWVPLGKLIKSGPQNGVYLHQSQYGSGCPILRIDDFQPGWVRPAGELRRVNADDEIRTCYSLRESDVVVNRVNSPSHLGKCLVVSGQHEGALFESNMMRFRVDECLLPRYLELYLRSELGRRRLTANCKHAVNQASINQKDVASTLVPLPTVDEQSEIVNRASKALSDSEAAVAVLEESQQQSVALRQCILKAAFSGQLVPQGPTDEPASALLARFAEEATDAPATERRRASRARSKSPTA